MTKNFINVSDLLMSSENVVLQMSSNDLKGFARAILLGAQSIAREEAKAAAKADQLLTIDEASQLLSV